jgi:predicted AlkP superfamily pyrophosphatase or phosphodiesterase
MHLAKLRLCSLFLLCFSIQAAQPPKLVVSIVIDQLRYDYLTRFRADYHGGLDYLLTHGADFTNAYYAQMPTVTAVGHSLMLSGAMPAVSGIVGNTWYDRDEAKFVTSVCDWDYEAVGGEQPVKGEKCTDSDPGSPRRLLVSTLGDELRNAHEESKVVGVSIKARGAILPSGHRALGAFWFDDVSGHFVTSTFYMKQLPAWAEEFNAKKLADSYVTQNWDGFPSWHFKAAPGAPPFSLLPASPWGNELIEGFAEQAVTGEKLGQRGVTDLLTVSFSSNDYVGHAVGPDAPEVRDMAIRTDQLLAKLFAVLDKEVGMSNVVVVLSADHGVAPTGKHDEDSKMPGGYLLADLEDAAQSALSKAYGPGKYLIAGAGESSLYFNWPQLAKAKVSASDAYNTVRNAVLAIPQLHVARVYSRDQLMNGVAGDFIAQAAMNGFFPRRSGDLSIVFEPYYIPGISGTSHYSPYGYDRHVPVLFAGPGIKAGRYNQTIHPNDIAPTLATMLDLETPSGSSGRVLDEILTPR